MAVETTIGERLSDLRIEAGLTQDELAVKIGVKRSKITDWENGRSKLKSEQIIALADALNTSCDKILRDIRPEYLEIQKATGLSDKAIETLAMCKETEDRYLSRLSLAIVNYILDSQSNVYRLANQIGVYSKYLKTCVGLAGAINIHKDIDTVDYDEEIFKKIKNDGILYHGIAGAYQKTIIEIIDTAIKNNHLGDEDLYIEMLVEDINGNMKFYEWDVLVAQKGFVHDAAKAILLNQDSRDCIAFDCNWLEKLGVK